MSLAYVLSRTSRASPVAALFASGRSAFASPVITRTPAVFNMAPQRRKTSSLPEGYKEDMSKGKMLRFEDSLPTLPVPALKETTDRYLKTVHPLVTEQEYETTKQAVAEFIKPGGWGEELHKRLVARKEAPGTKNWLHEWWNNLAYLGDRGPVVPFVSYFYSHRDDRNRRDPAKRAAAISTAALEFKRQVDEGSLEPEYMRKAPIAMSSYWWMFNACRIPSEPADYPVKYPYKDHPYILVIRKNQFFKVMHEVDGKQLNTAELEKAFKIIYQTAENSPAIGAMTTERRNHWAAMRQRLIEANPANKTALETVQAASFVVCLDDARPITLNERAHQYWHGDGCNRFFDKPLQFIINDNGTSGFMGEHSMMDGTPTHRLNDYVANMTLNNKLDFTDTSIRSNIPDPAPLKFELNQQVQRDITSALAFHTTTIAEHDLYVCAYQGYGKGMIKKFKASPDAYVQMIIQLAYHKMFGRNRPTYESAATRKFQQGRTETCRTVSDASVAFCDAMADPSASTEQCIELFRAAVKAHTKYISDASDGHGVDRPLLGMKLCLKDDEPLPDIYKDPAYTYTQTWYISSSQLSSEYFNGYGWSQVIDDGWGIAYMVNENSLQFNIVSKGLGCERMSFYISEAAGDIRDMMMTTLQSKAKL